MRQVIGLSSRRRARTGRLSRWVLVGGAVVAVAALAAALALPAPSAAATVAGYGPPSVVGQVPTNGGFVSQVAVADFNGDGLDDALFTPSAFRSQQTFPVAVLLNDGHGSFVDATSAIFVGAVPTTQNPRELVVADFNGDHRPDVFIADHGDDRDPFPGYQNTLILSAPDGKLVDATANLPQAYDFTHSAAAGDINGDGRADLYVGNIYGSNRVPPRILLGDGTGHFSIGAGLLPTAQADLNLNTYTSSLFLDVNGDGRLDLILGGDNRTRSVVLLGDGTGHFTPLPNALPAKPFGPDAIALDIASEDVNADRHPDLLIAFTKSNPFYVGRWIQVLINNGDGTFRDETASRLPQTDNNGAWSSFIRQRDLNRDRRGDFGLQVIGGTGSAPLFILDSHGVFEPGPPVNVGTQTWSFIDAEGDGSNDILAANSAAVSLFRERLVPDTTAPTLTRLKLSPSVFRAARSGASVAAAKVGTKLSYTASEPATTTFKVEDALPGVRRGRSCVMPLRTAPPMQRCTRFVMVRGTFAHRDSAGPNHMRFTGHVRTKALKPGTYRLNATPKDAAGNIGHTVKALFRIVR